jgi:hypothetical protein
VNGEGPEAGKGELRGLLQCSDNGTYQLTSGAVCGCAADLGRLLDDRGDKSFGHDSTPTGIIEFGIQIPLFDTDKHLVSTIMADPANLAGM